MRKFGLIGKNISYSFSKSYFELKFKDESITDASYENFDIENMTSLPSVLKNNLNLKGMNVTIPYKETIIPYLDKIDKKAKEIGAINTVKITKKGKLKGYNTDYYGFKKSIKTKLKPHHKTALILGTGGASKAIAYGLKKLNISYYFVSRQASEKVSYTYSQLTEQIINAHTIIINCTPLGTHPNIDQFPDIPYQGITQNHLLFDLIYNPEETIFLKHGNQKKATTINGLDMLKNQAEKAWEIWNS